MNTCTNNINVKYSEMDHNLALKPFSLLNFLQDIASESAENLGFGYTFMSKNNLAWFLIKYRMEFNDYPVGVYNLTLKTKPRGYNKLFAYREFELYEKEKQLGKVFSIWSIVDKENRTTIPVSSVILDNPKMQPYIKKDGDLSFARVKPIENYSLKKEFEVRYNDIDVNGHANNGNYIVWAFEPLSLEFKTEHKIKTIDMIYKKEAVYGEKITSEVEVIDNKSYHRIKNSTGDDLLLVECEWI
jgi:medium-chain acyl-[acyl-carrier-protein] hydrolase